MKLRYALLMLGLALAGCGQAPATSNTAATATAAVGADLPDHSEHGPGKDAMVIDYDTASVLVTLDLMRGHLLSSLENARLGDYTFAQQHAVHPLAEHYQQIKSLVQESDAATDAALETAFKTYQQQVTAKADIATIEQSKTAVETQLDKIESVLVPSHTDVHSRALASVMKTAAAEYGESIKDGAFVAPIEYQDAFGFTRVAEAQFAKLKPELSPEAAQTTQTALDTLTAAMPTIQPPQSVARTAAEVAGASSSVEERLGIAQAAGTDTTSLATGLNRLAHESLNQIDAAIDANDLAGATAAWEAFDAGWSAIEDGVRERSKDSYGAIEDAMDEVEDAVVRAEQPNAAEVKAGTAALRAEIEKFVESLK